MVQTHYDNLQVTRTASAEVIRGAYRYLSQKWHPDKNPGNRAEAERILKAINRAYEVLSDPIRRREHDDWILEQEADHASSERESTPAGEKPSQTWRPDRATSSKQDYSRAMGLLLTAMFMATLIWQFRQFDAGDGHAWRLPKIPLYFFIASCWFAFDLGVRGAHSDNALLSGGFLKGWLVALLALSGTIAGLFSLFFFGLDSQTLASISGSAGTNFSGDSLYAISLASTLLWSPIIAISFLLPARLMVFAYRSIRRSTVATPQQDKAWTLLGAMVLMWLLSLLVASQ